MRTPKRADAPGASALETFVGIGNAAGKPRANSALTRLEALLDLVDDVDAALAANQLVVAVTGAQRLERIADLHRLYSVDPPSRACRSKIHGRDADRQAILIDHSNGAADAMPAVYGFFR
jgi:hypothetical protein